MRLPPGIGETPRHTHGNCRDGTFTNIRGQFFVGHEAYLKRHE